MNMKNNKKKSPMMKIVSAAAMLAVSASMLGTSTYAWFTMNTTVKATGMQVNAKADPSLVIKGVADETNGWSTSDTAFTDLGTTTGPIINMRPATSADGVTFGKLAGDASVKSAANAAATWGDDADFDETNLTQVNVGKTSEQDPSNNYIYYVANPQFQLKSIGSAQTVYVKSVTATVVDGDDEGADATNELNKSVRVAVVANSNTKIFNPNSGTLNDDGKAGKYASSTWSLDTPSYITPNTSNASLGTFTADTAVGVQVYIWFEGQDTMCYTDNISPDNIAIEIEFTTTAPNGG
jgi:hypothetical protein